MALPGIALVGHILKATHIQKVPSQELWRMWETFVGTLVNARELLVNVASCIRRSSPNFARLRQSSHEGAHMLQIPPERRTQCNSGCPIRDVSRGLRAHAQTHTHTPRSRGLNKISTRRTMLSDLPAWLD